LKNTTEKDCIVVGCCNIDTDKLFYVGKGKFYNCNRYETLSLKLNNKINFIIFYCLQHVL